MAEVSDNPVEIGQLKKTRKASIAWLTRAANQLDALSNGNNDLLGIDTVVDEFNKRLVKLDKIQDQIECNLSDDDLLQDIEEAAAFRDKALYYLRTLLVGNAKECLNGLSLTGANYQIAIYILKSRFGRKEKIIFGHIQILLALTMERNNGPITVAGL
jgi:hypothetical protein